jgi:hypothetical protein
MGVDQLVKSQSVSKTQFEQYNKSMQENGMAKIILNSCCGWNTNMKKYPSRNWILTMYARDAVL